MATAKFNRASDMLELGVYYGEIVENTSSTIHISDGYNSTTYKGDFYYYLGDVYGALESVVDKVGGATIYEISNINRDVYTFNEYFYRGDAEGGLSFVLSGSDRLEGSNYSDRLVGFAGSDKLYGNGGNDKLHGNGGSDKLHGNSGSDKLYGNSGSDTLYGGKGGDRLNGGTGSDYMAGGSGSDTYIVNSTRDRVVEKAGQGTEQVKSSVSFTLGTSLEKLKLTGHSDINGTGNSLANKVYGNSSDNVLKGLSGNDLLKGNGGEDLLVGGSGKDVLTGGSQADTFVFRSAKEAGIGSGRDVITDFKRGYDAIDLSSMDAVVGRSGNQRFEFIGKDAFSKTAGELQFRDGILRGDTDGDGRNDFTIEVTEVSALSEADFWL